MSPRRGHAPWVTPLLLVTAAACSTAPPPPGAGPRPVDPGPPAVVRLVARADDLAERGEGHAALALYERALREHPADPAAAAALYGIGRLQVHPTGGLRNYRAAHRTFSRLLADYPDSRWEAAARAWRAVLGDLIAHEDEATRLRNQIERLRRTDLDLERRR